MDYTSLIKSIPNDWKQEILQEYTNRNQDQTKIYMYQHSHLTQMEKVCNKVYWYLIKNMLHQNKNNMQRWEEVFDITLENNVQEDIYRLPWHATLDTKLRTFQYKLLKRILPTKIHLKKYNITDNDLCSFCAIQPESYEHLFHHCPVSHALQIRLVNWLSPQLMPVEPLSGKNVILGYTNIPCIKVTNLINTIMMIYKYYIYKCKCKETPLNFGLLLKDIKQHFCIESNSQNVSKRTKWEILEHKLQNV